MAKTRHRTFEMFDFLLEATDALASRSARVTTDSGELESWKFQQLIAASRPSGVVHITFKRDANSEADAVNDLGTDLTDLAGLLVNGSRVLMDFEGVPEFGADSIVNLTEFNRRLLAKGSRVVLCNLEPTVRASFFPHINTNEGIE